MDKNFVVYKIHCISNNKDYIGITGNIKSRFSDHRYGIKNNRQNVLYRTIRKYGEKNFETTIIDNASTWEELCEKEIYWIKKLNTKVPNGMNMTDGGEGALGLKHTQETKQFLSDIIPDDWRGENCPSSKLTEKEILEIRKKYKNGNIKQTDLAIEYNVSRTTIGYILSGKTWSHLKENILSDNEINKISLKLRKDNAPNGEKHHGAKLTKDDVISIRKKYKIKGVFLKDLSKEYGLTIANIQRIVSGVIWGSVKDEILTPEELKNKRHEAQIGNVAWNKGIKGCFSKEARKKMSDSSKDKTSGEKNGNGKLTEKDVIEIREIYKRENKTYVEIAKMFNVSPDNISMIVRRKTWKHI